MRRLVSITLGVCTLAASVVAQMPGRKPGPEHTRIAYFAGQWKVEGESEGLKYTLNETCEWFAGGFHLVCRGEGGGGLGPLKTQAIFAYDRGAKSYTLHTMNNLGNTVFAKGSVTAKVWTWDTELTGESGLFKARLTITEQSPTVFTVKLEGLLGGNWVALEEERATKTK